MEGFKESGILNQGSIMLREISPDWKITVISFRRPQFDIMGPPMMPKCPPPLTWNPADYIKYYRIKGYEEAPEWGRHYAERF